MYINYTSGVAMGRGLESSPFVTNETSYLVTLIRILQNLYFIYPM